MVCAARMVLPMESVVLISISSLKISCESCCCGVDLSARRSSHCGTEQPGHSDSFWEFHFRPPEVQHCNAFESLDRQW
jgi:hypothetical protein